MLSAASDKLKPTFDRLIGICKVLARTLVTNRIAGYRKKGTTKKGVIVVSERLRNEAKIRLPAGA
jgi:hypothetical protein